MALHLIRMTLIYTELKKNQANKYILHARRIVTYASYVTYTITMNLNSQNPIVDIKFND